MAGQKARSGGHKSTGRRVGRLGSADNPLTTFYVGQGQTLPKGAKGFKLKVSDTASMEITRSPQNMKALLQAYGDAITKSRRAGRRVSLRVDVDADGETIHTTFEDEVAAPQLPEVDIDEQNSDLEAALTAARERGRVHAAKILSGSEMLSADEFAKVLGTSRVTVNAKRQKGQVLGLDGAKRGFRFPKWQLNSEGKPYGELEELHDLLGGPWAVYRFLVQTHGELNGLTGLKALERGTADAAIEAAKSVGRDFR